MLTRLNFEIPISLLSDRLDVTYYWVCRTVQQSLKAKSGLPLNRLCKRLRTRTPPSESYQESGIPCLKLRNVTGKTLNISNCDYVAERLGPSLVYAKANDLIITATGEGTAGRVDIFLETGRYIVTGENILLRPESGRINPFYLLAILRTEIMSMQLSRFVRGATGQTHLYWQDIEHIHIPLASPPVQGKCEELFRAAWKKRRLAAECILKAKNIVIKSSGTEKLNVRKRDLFFETSFSEVKAMLRFDVEYYQPIHYTLKAILTKAHCGPATEVAKLNKNKTNPRKSPSAKFQYIDITNIDAEIGDYQLTETLGHEAPTRARKKPDRGDLLVATVRPKRNAIALVAEKITGLVVSTGLAIVKPKGIDPLVLFAILKSEPIYSQIVRKATAAMYPAVKDEDVVNLLIPKLTSGQQESIKEWVKESISLRKESDNLLQELKSMGEYAIKKEGFATD